MRCKIRFQWDEEAAVWIATVAIAAYAYPRIEEFANIWNEYLLP